MRHLARFRSAAEFGLALALVAAVAACQPAALSSFAPTTAPVVPTLTAIPATIAAPVPATLPSVAGAGYPPDTRTDVAVLDAIIDAVTANDPARVRELTHYTRVGCTTAAGFGGPPKCQAGESAGMKVEAVPVMGAEGYALRRTDPGVGISAEGYRLMAAIADVEEAIRAEEWWLPAKYVLVFVSPDSTGAVILPVDEAGIVRFIHVETVDRAWQLVSGDFILPPVR